MTPERWRQIEELYHEALLRPAEARADFIAAACGSDPALRREVEALLDERSKEGFLSTPAFVGVAAEGGASLTGRRLGVYLVQEQIGAGGMGEVYRARDTRLARDVAIKILPPALVATPDRRARFEREARMLAALNHPNIGSIYGFEESIGGLVLELVEGETLAERIRRGPVPVKDVVAIARQVVEALDAAHEKGIVHRDLKPANIKITPQGLVKVLDFGLAKAGGDGSTSALTQSPTMTSGGTREGIILGTAPYMSPEQARGQAVDKRTDVWACGCLIYEMLTGRPPFPGKTVSDTIAKILESEPDWTSLPVATPPGVRRLLPRCLDKDVKRRLRDIGDARPDLDETFEPTGATAAMPSRRIAQMAPWAVAAVAVIAAIGFGWTAVGRPAVPAAPLTLGPMTRLTSESGLATDPSISADGRLVAYASNRSDDGNLDIYVQQTAGGAVIRLTDNGADDHEPDVSPDGSVVAFRSERSPAGIYVASALGGGARLIAEGGMAPQFSPDGRSIAFWTGRRIAPRSEGIVRQVHVMPSTGGAAVRVATNIENAGDPVWSPDGRSLMVFGRATISGVNSDPDWWRVSVDTGSASRSGAFERFKAQRLELGLTDIYPYVKAWTPGGVLFTALTGNREVTSLWLLPVDEGSGRPAGDAVRLTNGTTTDAALDIARDGRMVFSAQDVMPALIFALPLEANTGRVTGPLRPVRDDATPTGRTSVSVDGRLLVFPKYEFGAGGVWVRDQRTGQERQLAAAPITPLNPVISADGSWVAYTVTKVETGGNAGVGDGYVVATTGGVPRKICESCEVDGWTTDNRELLIHGPGRKEFTRVDLASGNRMPLLVALNDSVDRPMFGPSGRWFTFNGEHQVFVAPVHTDRATPQSELTPLIDLRGGGERTAGLSPDGRLLYVLLERDGFRCLYAMPLDPVTGFRAGDPFIVLHAHDAGRRFGSTGLGSAVARGVFVTDVFESTGNIWMAQLNQSQRDVQPGDGAVSEQGVEP